MKNFGELENELQRLRLERSVLQERLAISGKNIAEAISHPALTIKEAVADLASDKWFIADVLTLLVNLVIQKMRGPSKQPSSQANRENDGRENETRSSEGIAGFLSDLLRSYNNSKKK
jgi:hypothetical protein